MRNNNYLHTVKQLSLWGEEDVSLTTDEQFKTNELQNHILVKPARKMHRYLNKHYLPDYCDVEGIEEFPRVQPYTGELPIDFVGYNGNNYYSNISSLGVDFFQYDDTLERYWNTLPSVITKLKGFRCAIGMDFSPLVDGRRCEVVEAIRRNRTSTLYMQQHGIPTIQCGSFGSVNSFDYVFDGLAPNAPTAIEHNISSNNRAKKRLFQAGVEELVNRKSPSILIVVGFPLDFDPGIPVKYYKSRIQKLRERYGK